MELLLIDVNSIQMISDWVDRWSVKRYGNKGNIEIINGKKRLNPAWFYGNDERYIYTQIIKHNEEHATIEHVRELLLKIKNINFRLSDEGQSRHLTYDDRERLKAERQAFYDEYTLIVERTESEQPETLIDKNKLKELFIPVFFDKDYDVKDDSNKSVKISRFDKFCNRLELKLNEGIIINKTIGKIVYMIYLSQYLQPLKKGKKMSFTQVRKKFCEAIKVDNFDYRPSQCKNPDDELKQWFDML